MRVHHARRDHVPGHVDHLGIRYVEILAHRDDDSIFDQQVTPWHHADGRIHGDNLSAAEKQTHGHDHDPFSSLSGQNEAEEHGETASTSSAELLPASNIDRARPCTVDGVLADHDRRH
ncbi:hypothetical protein Aau02nite_65350 [Amorphoplanes auranticolor]|uniref:Uncharacterized protein n=1 Tax=Actinoplanes auranticolor TaxID=47988 RepID=A0A919SMU7_9ACTN|nr:hypothetical protein Aau02nite_65350 [Actinoplanes auranticolor]